MSVSTLSKQEKLKALSDLHQFIGQSQLETMVYGLMGEEKDYFRGKIREYAERIRTMPVTYEQDGLGNKAIVYLHYFNGSSDWYITEKDMSGDDEEGQMQAFGYSVLNGNKDYAEMGYINIKELLKYGVELDLHFTPQPLGNFRQ